MEAQENIQLTSNPAIKCFSCKKSGEAIFCGFSSAFENFEPCDKAYHLPCSNMASMSPSSKGVWCCPRHYCKECNKFEGDGVALIKCQGCPSSFCAHHIPTNAMVVYNSPKNILCASCMDFLHMRPKNQNKTLLVTRDWINHLVNDIGASKQTQQQQQQSQHQTDQPQQSATAPSTSETPAALPADQQTNEISLENPMVTDVPSAPAESSGSSEAVSTETQQQQAAESGAAQPPAVVKMEEAAPSGKSIVPQRRVPLSTSSYYPWRPPHRYHRIDPVDRMHVDEMERTELGPSSPLSLVNAAFMALLEASSPLPYQHILDMATDRGYLVLAQGRGPSLKATINTLRQVIGRNMDFTDSVFEYVGSYLIGLKRFELGEAKRPPPPPRHMAQAEGQEAYDESGQYGPECFDEEGNFVGPEGYDEGDYGEGYPEDMYDDGEREDGDFDYSQELAAAGAYSRGRGRGGRPYYRGRGGRGGFGSGRFMRGGAAGRGRRRRKADEDGEYLEHEHGAEDGDADFVYEGAESEEEEDEFYPVVSSGSSRRGKAFRSHGFSRAQDMAAAQRIFVGSFKPQRDYKKEEGAASPTSSGGFGADLSGYEGVKLEAPSPSYYGEQGGYMESPYGGWKRGPVPPGSIPLPPVQTVPSPAYQPPVAPAQLRPIARPPPPKPTPPQPLTIEQPTAAAVQAPASKRRRGSSKQHAASTPKGSQMQQEQQQQAAARAEPRYVQTLSSFRRDFAGESLPSDDDEAMQVVRATQPQVVLTEEQTRTEPMEPVEGETSEQRCARFILSVAAEIQQESAASKA